MLLLNTKNIIYINDRGALNISNDAEDYRV